MRRLLSIASWIAVVGSMLGAAGCNDVGDSSAAIGGGITSTGDDAASPGLLGDGSPASADDGSPGSATGDATIVNPGDAGVVDSTTPRAGNEDAAPDDAGAVDSTGTLDAGADASATDSGAPDSTMPDAGEGGDGSAVDAGIADARTGGEDSGSDAEHGAADSGGDGAGGSLAACKTAGQTGCVQCQFNNGAAGTLPNVDQVCTPTEAALVEHDIATGAATAPGPDPDGSCYQCAALSGCLDDSEFNDKAHECEDLSGASTQECEATLGCILGSSCGLAAVSTCYCGTAPVSGSCAAVGTTNAANGACAGPEATGLGFASNDGLDILKNFTSTTLPSGVANNIFQCAASNSCTACLH